MNVVPQFKFKQPEFKDMKFSLPICCALVAVVHAIPNPSMQTRAGCAGLGAECSNGGESMNSLPQAMISTIEQSLLPNWSKHMCLLWLWTVCVLHGWVFEWMCKSSAERDIECY